MERICIHRVLLDFTRTDNFFFFFASQTDKWNWTFFQLQSWLITKQLDNDLNAAVKNC